MKRLEREDLVSRSMRDRKEVPPNAPFFDVGRRKQRARRGAIGFAVVLATASAVATPADASAALRKGDGYQVRFPDRIERGQVTFEQGGHRVGFQLRGARGAMLPTKDGTRVRSALPGVSVGYQLAPRSLKETLVLHRRSSASRFRFVMTVDPGLRPTLRADKSVLLRDGSGKPAMAVTAPFMYDSAKPKPELSRAFDVELRRLGAGRYEYEMTASRRWLGDRKRSWPVTIDPTLVSAAAVSGGPLPGPSNCEIDDDPVARMCVPPEKVDFPFTANQVDPANPTGRKLVTSCTASLQAAAPPADDATGRVQFRTRSACNNALKVVELDSRLLDVTGAVVAEAPRAFCHNSTAGCGPQETTLVDKQGLPTGDYVLQSTVRFVLQDPAAPDPWSEPPPSGTTPTDEPLDPANRGICAPGFLVIRCNLRLPITVDGTTGDLIPWVEPIDGRREMCRRDPFAYSCPLNPRLSPARLPVRFR